MLGCVLFPRGRMTIKTDLQIRLDDIYDENDKNGYK